MARKLVVRNIAVLVMLVMTGCTVERTRTVYIERPAPPPPVRHVEPAPAPVVSVYVDPPLVQPEPVAISWAPPPLLVESPPPPPFDDAIWIGGYWVWNGNWVWAHGRWVAPPRRGYSWVHPYYENRDGMVIFVDGFWAAPGVHFEPPPPHLSISVSVTAVGVIPGPRPIGPSGVFIPPPPGSRAGLIVPAPIGTPPAVVTSAPPVVNVGMRITNNVNNNVTNNRTTNVTNVTNVTNINNVTIVAPPSATANGQAVNASVPGQAHLAAAMKPVVRVPAPAVNAGKPIPSYVPGHPPAALPPAQQVHQEPAGQGNHIQNQPGGMQNTAAQPNAQNAPRPAPHPGTEGAHQDMAPQGNHPDNARDISNNARPLAQPNGAGQTGANPTQDQANHNAHGTHPQGARPVEDDRRHDEQARAEERSKKEREKEERRKKKEEHNHEAN